MTTIITTLLVSFCLAAVLGFLLGFFKKVFYVPVDETVTRIRAVLPGANCGACGYPGCDGFAASVAAGEAPPTGCMAGGASVAAEVGKVLGVSASIEAKVAVLACQGSAAHAQNKGIYNGVPTCAAAKISVNGTKQCPYGCIGFGDCAAACAFGALSVGVDGLPRVNYRKCVGCGMCAKACPQGLFATVPASRSGAVALCSNRTTNKQSVLKQCKAGCIKCGKCEKTCPNQAIALVKGVPSVDYAKCVSCGACVAGCPTHALVLVQDRAQGKKKAEQTA
ncbi:RnfABCDGE type electron transport complex subunit B [Treponema endosymbiont of Eucomonympha sp.]|uniref:RnfABCDGE type electron transport complex subunit B n=1 Tax=Treponema endosymbiont of Eucomonympha sp. TaxID=1580831 RepID=UPI0007833930|nr:RnfABCDGE type electron transport complex subunit B [Treponema endosymbiont of Eucomonympha sp.]